MLFQTAHAYRYQSREILNMLRTGSGQGRLVRALFEDCSRETLENIASYIGLTTTQLILAYKRAKTEYQVVNKELDYEISPP